MPGPRKQFDPDQALEKAVELFWARGYEGTSQRDLLTAMGIGNKSLYDTFGNKRQLFHKAIERYGLRALDMVRGILKRPGSPLENVLAVLDVWEGMDVKRRSRGCMIGCNIAHFDVEDGEMAGILRRHLKHMEQAFSAALTRADEAGELPAGVVAEEAAAMLVTLAQGAALISRVRPAPASIRGAFSMCRKALGATA